MNDAECPYCGEYTEIVHDDGYGLDESGKYEQECGHCGKTFAYTTFFSTSYTTNRADCLNGGNHQMEPVIHAPRVYPDWQRCVACGYEVRGEYQDTSDRIGAAP